MRVAYDQVLYPQRYIEMTDVSQTGWPTSLRQYKRVLQRMYSMRYRTSCSCLVDHDSLYTRRYAMPFIWNHVNTHASAVELSIKQICLSKISWGNVRNATEIMHSSLLARSHLHRQKHYKIIPTVLAPNVPTSKRSERKTQPSRIRTKADDATGLGSHGKHDRLGTASNDDMELVALTRAKRLRLT